MSTRTENELASFHRFIAQQLGSDRADLSPEQALGLWREQHPPAEEDPETIGALREALADFDSGDRGVPLEQFRREFRRRHGLDGSA